MPLEQNSTSDDQSVPLSEELVRGQLSRLLNDPRFARSQRLCSLLRYTVEKVLAGEAGQLKEYTIALEVYGKPPSYDPSVDSLVRVEVTRLRNKLLEYYSTEGSADPVRIEFPKGTYAPVFVNRSPPVSVPSLGEAELTVASLDATGRTQPRWPHRRTALALTFCLAVAIVAVLLSMTLRKSSQSGPISPSIAVLPFTSFSSDPETQTFAAELTEDVIHSLSRAGEWRVTAQTSTLPFKNSPATLASIGRQLHVNALLEGSIRKEAGRLRVTVQLINAADGYYVWTESYDREGQPVLSVEAELSATMAHTVSTLRHSWAIANAAVTPAVREARVATEQARVILDQNAIDYLMIRGPKENYRGKLDELMSAIQNLERATSLDPRYLPAYAGLAQAYSLAADFDERMADKAVQVARRGLQIDDRIPEAHFVLAYYKFLRDWDIPGAIQEWKRTLELNSRDVTACRLYADCCALKGDWDSAFAALRRAQQAVPDSPVIALEIGITLYYARRFDELAAHARQVKWEHPDLPLADWLAGLALESKGKYTDAITSFETCQRRSPLDIKNNPSLGHAYGLAGRRADAFRLIQIGLDRALKGALGPYSISLMYLGLGDKESALTWLEKAYEVHEPAILYIKVDPRYDPLRTEPRFVALMKKIKL